MEDATLLWFWVLSLLLMNYKWQRGKWRTLAVTVCQPHSLCVRCFGWITFPFSVHLHHSLWLPSSPLPPLLSLPSPEVTGRWKRGQALQSDLVSLKGWDWMGLSDGTRVVLSKHLSRCRVLHSAITCLQTGRHSRSPALKCVLSRDAVLSSSLSIKKPASRMEQGLLIAGSSFFVFLQVLIYCYKVLVFLKCVFNERGLLLSWYIMGWTRTYSAQCGSSHQSILLLPKYMSTKYLFPLLKKQKKPNKTTTTKIKTKPKQKKDKTNKKGERDTEREKLILVNFATWNHFFWKPLFEVGDIFQWNPEEKKILILFAWK